MTEFIKCCPFCGSNEVDIARTNENSCWVECVECGGKTESHSERKHAIEAWNYRCHDEVCPSKIVYDMDAEEETRKREAQTDE